LPLVDRDADADFGVLLRNRPLRTTSDRGDSGKQTPERRLRLRPARWGSYFLDDKEEWALRSALVASRFHPRAPDVSKGVLADGPPRKRGPGVDLERGHAAAARVRGGGEAQPVGLPTRPHAAGDPGPALS